MSPYITVQYLLAFWRTGAFCATVIHELSFILHLDIFERLRFFDYILFFRQCWSNQAQVKNISRGLWGQDWKENSLLSPTFLWPELRHMTSSFCNGSYKYSFNSILRSRRKWGLEKTRTPWTVIGAELRMNDFSTNTTFSWKKEV